MKRLVKLTSFLLVSSVFQASAVGLSTYRIYLDENNSQVDFKVRNTETSEQRCKLTFSDLKYSKQSTILPPEQGAVIEHSAAGHFRYSPKKFTLGPLGKQTIKFSLRKKRGQKDKEFRSYVSVTCTEKQAANSGGLISLVPNLSHKIPVVIRMGKHNLEARFSKASLVNNKVELEISRSGSRSLYGDVQLIDKQSGEIIDEQRGIAVYPEADTRTLEFYVEPSNKQIIAKFIERQSHGGDLEFETTIR